jgi:hypothetical protein
MPSEDAYVLKLQRDLHKARQQLADEGRVSAMISCGTCENAANEIAALENKVAGLLKALEGQQDAAFDAGKEGVCAIAESLFDFRSPIGPLHGAGVVHAAREISSRGRALDHNRTEGKK